VAIHAPNDGACFFRRIACFNINVPTCQKTVFLFNNHGIEPLRAGEGLFRPAVFALLRSVYSTNRIKWHMQRMSFLSEDKPGDVDALPSSIVIRALCKPGSEIKVTLHGHLLRVGNTQFHFDEGGLDDAKDWMRDW
jgi:hypothetical protein